MENIQDIICAIRRTVERHKLADGRYCRWLWQPADPGKPRRQLSAESRLKGVRLKVADDQPDTDSDQQNTDCDHDSRRKTHRIDQQKNPDLQLKQT